MFTVKQSRLSSAVNEEEREDPVRVLIINDHLGFADGSIHGATTLYYSILTKLNPSRIQGRLCIFKPRHPAATRFETAGIDPIFFGRAKWDPRALADLIQLVREQEIDILHVNSMKAYIFGRMAAAVTGCRVIMHFHDTNRPGPVLGVVQRLLMPWTDLALAVSPHVKDMAIDAYAIPPDRIRVLPNGVDVEQFDASRSEASSALREEWGIAEDVPLIGVIGRMAGGKGQKLLLQGLPSLIREYPNAQVVFVGDGPMRDSCESLAAELEVESNVRFTGYRSDIPEVLATVDVVALPSILEEGHPITVLEAMAAGKPVVAFAVGGTPEIINHHKDGLLIPKGDIDRFTRAIARLLRDKELRVRLGRAGQKRAQDFSSSAYVSQLEDIYLSVMSRAD